MILERIDRGLYEPIRKSLVEGGYLPDITTFTSQADYKSAKVTLRESRPDKTIIEIFGVGSAESRDEKTDAKIIIDRKAIKPSNIGAFPEIKILPANDVNSDFDTGFGGESNTYNKYLLPDGPYDIDYEVRIICTTTKHDRIMNELLLFLLGTRKYLSFIDEQGIKLDDNFLLLYSGSVDLTRGNFIERIFRYTAVEVWLTQATLIESEIPELIGVEGTAIVIPTDTEIVEELPPPAPEQGVEFNLVVEGRNPKKINLL